MIPVLAVQVLKILIFSDRHFIILHLFLCYNMPASKCALAERIAEMKEDIAIGDSTAANVGTFLVFSTRGRKGPFRAAIANEVNSGFVVSVRFADGSIESALSYKSKPMCWLTPDCRFEGITPQEALKAVGSKEEISLESLRERVLGILEKYLKVEN